MLGKSERRETLILVFMGATAAARVPLILSVNDALAQLLYCESNKFA